LHHVGQHAQHFAPQRDATSAFAIGEYKRSALQPAAQFEEAFATHVAPCFARDRIRRRRFAWA
jgi:hypothetical protein